jgi:sulfur carrier protein
LNIPVRVNGTPDERPPGTTVAALVTRIGAGRKGVAVAVNSAVVPRSSWDGVELEAGDVVEILRAAQGG